MDWGDSIKSTGRNLVVYLALAEFFETFANGIFCLFRLMRKPKQEYYYFPVLDVCYSGDEYRMHWSHIFGKWSFLYVMWWGFRCLWKGKKKHEQVYTLSEWITIAKRARQINKFDVQEMSNESFLAFKNLTLDIVNLKTDIHGNKVQWLKIRWIIFKKNTQCRCCVNSQWTKTKNSRLLTSTNQKEDTNRNLQRHTHFISKWPTDLCSKTKRLRWLDEIHSTHKSPILFWY